MKTNPLYHMKNKLLAANWKSNKTKFEAKDWLVEISNYEFPEGVEVILFPPSTLLDVVSGYVRVNSMPFKIGAQDVSPFGPGAYTGEVSAEQIKEFADYVLIGHLERRVNFSESTDMIIKKIDRAISVGLTPIVCVSELKELSGLSSSRIVVAYEPISAIGTGEAMDPNLVEDFSKEIKKINIQNVIYGGSVNSENVKNYLSLPSVDGLLVGGQSLDPKSFADLIKNAV